MWVCRNQFQWIIICFSILWRYCNQCNPQIPADYHHFSIFPADCIHDFSTFSRERWKRWKKREDSLGCTKILGLAVASASNVGEMAEMGANPIRTGHQSGFGRIFGSDWLKYIVNYLANWRWFSVFQGRIEGFEPSSIWINIGVSENGDTVYCIQQFYVPFSDKKNDSRSRKVVTMMQKMLLGRNLVGWTRIQVRLRFWVWYFLNLECFQSEVRENWRRRWGRERSLRRLVAVDVTLSNQTTQVCWRKRGNG